VSQQTFANNYWQSITRDPNFMILDNDAIVTMDKSFS